MDEVLLSRRVLSDAAVTRLTLRTEFVALDILHIGSIPSCLESYITKNNIQYKSSSTHRDHTEVDIITVNNESSISNKTLKALDDLKLIVTYTTSLYIKAGSEFIHFSLIPILLKYLAKIKGSMNFLNKKITTDSADIFLNKVTKIIDENIDNDTLNMQQLSELLYMSRSSLSKKIKTHTGLKPTAFINKYKLEKSKHLLIVTNWQISRISDALGFSSQQYYCRLFKKHFRDNPTQYRVCHKDQSYKVDSIPQKPYTIMQI
ncbi:helix-turn-helix transcriptional regulator [Lacinutrix neustonica]|uniref:Helix-turn-helix transcriptional regulator n=1 Tax=Lacinutrix neustonica TaxID=2980107 RepID=A0A9E8MYN6_9FLAO|nr:helix-turn-helix transcriptional regulator [Lacinutrix neustonica]WAC02669.1 helix-turn-helix transcriptional regulator [Lacinutrix neustonica]